MSTLLIQLQENQHFSPMIHIWMHACIHTYVHIHIYIYTYIHVSFEMVSNAMNEDHSPNHVCGGIIH